MLYAQVTNYYTRKVVRGDMSFSGQVHKPTIKTQSENDPVYEFSLDDRYYKTNGSVLLTGIQALTRLPLDQYRADQRMGLNTATLISGYRGSPLGGLDITLQRESALLAQHNIHFIPAINEELGATAILGSQVANLLPNPKYDGVLGMWYGKAPGVDRSGDAFKHANFAGISQYGGVLAIAGDDPISKSSTLPSHSEFALFDAHMPVLYPGNVQEILDYGRLGFELSRYSGLWVGFKIVTNVADEFSVAEVSPDRVILDVPDFTYLGKPWKATQSTRLLTPFSLSLERELVEGRTKAAKAFSVTNGLNCITVPTRDAWLGIIASGKTYYDVIEALRQMRIDNETLNHHGIRILKLGMISPIEPSIVREFANGLQEILVIEEKRAFIELFIKDILYSLAEHPKIVGKTDELGRTLVEAHGELNPDRITRIIAQRLDGKIEVSSISDRLRILDSPPQILTVPVLSRTPHYCSGCPHNSSTVAPENALVGAGIGCHTMTLLMNDDITGITQMGGEGVQWVGAAPFSENNHLFQNLGDGTFAHSASLAIRQAVAANVNITYKLLYNSAVAMTGGQSADGGMSVQSTVHSLLAEGVSQIIVTSDQPEKHHTQEDWPTQVKIWHRDRLLEAQDVLRQKKGVTVLIHDQECAAELRRKRRRGLAKDPIRRVMINELVCEGCGDCGAKSNCLSVVPVNTEYGRKTQIHQASCNKDFTCLKGDCPAFVSVIPNVDSQPKTIPFEVDVELPDPTYPTFDEYNIYMVGIGGTGVVTANQILGTAALLDGVFVRGLDQTGLSQKGGPVVSNLRLFDQIVDAANKVPNGSTDCYLVFDLLSGSEFSNLSRVNNKRTSAVVSTSVIATGSMISSVSSKFPNEERLIREIDNNTHQENNFHFDATGLSEILFGTHMQTNLIVIGAAYQQGLIPIHHEAIEYAVTLNGVAIQKNIAAFRAGRRAVADHEWYSSLEWVRSGEIKSNITTNPKAVDMVAQMRVKSDLKALLDNRVSELIEYQNIEYAQEYTSFVQNVIDIEKRNGFKDMKLSQAAARYLFKLMAYKDEYEVARLHLKAGFEDAIKREFGANIELSYMLHPPLLRSLGMKKKIKLGKWFNSIYRLLVIMRFLRGTALDIFGYAKVRRTERRLITAYKTMVMNALNELNEENYDKIVALASLPDMIRGYEHIKLNSIAQFKQEVERLGYNINI